MTGLWTVAPVVAPAVDPEKVTPGFGGFLVFFALALVSWLLYRSFTARMRRVDVRARLAAEGEAQEREAAAKDSGGPASGNGDTAGGAR